MKIEKKFNTLTVSEYISYIVDYKKYTDFNTLGLYRSILENEKLSLDEKIKVREYAHQNFKKNFDFLQLKDPRTYMDVSLLGQEYTEADRSQLWENVKKNQQKILADKKMKHRNFGSYSKHDCGYETCVFNGLMVKEGSFFADGHMSFDSDKNDYIGKVKSEKRKSDRKRTKQIVDKELDD